MRKFAGLVVGVLVAISGSAFVLGEDDKPKYTIKEVMQEAHKGGLLKKVLGSDPSQADRDKLVEFYTALAASKPPKGDEKEWKEKTSTLVTAAKALAKDAKDKKAVDTLKKATNCKACHEGFKG